MNFYEFCHVFIMLDILGITGVLVVLLDYYLLQSEKIKSTQVIYPLLNLIGGVLITISLFKDWNLSAFLMETSWVAVSVYGIYHILKKKKGRSGV